ncbi:MAG: TetR family transcriptional regulator [Rhodopila sp.]|nr:TetR family transcriptional regulator [Rhodopila sp.]
MRRTKAEAEQTRETVLKAAIKVFLKRGIARATLEEIARAAGVTRGAIYWHFRDKLEIFLALEERTNFPNDEVAAALESRLAADPRLDPLDELADAIGEGLRALENDVERRRILTIFWFRCEYVDEMLPALQRRQRLDATLQKRICGIMGLAAARGRLAPEWSADMAARALFLLLDRSVEDWLRTPDEFLLEVETMPLLRAFLRAVSVAVADAADQKAPRRFRRSAA